MGPDKGGSCPPLPPPSTHTHTHTHTHLPPTTNTHYLTVHAHTHVTLPPSPRTSSIKRPNRFPSTCVAELAPSHAHFFSSGLYAPVPPIWNTRPSRVQHTVRFQPHDTCRQAVAVAVAEAACVRRSGQQRCRRPPPPRKNLSGRHLSASIAEEPGWGGRATCEWMRHGEPNLPLPHSVTDANVAWLINCQLKKNAIIIIIIIGYLLRRSCLQRTCLVFRNAAKSIDQTERLEPRAYAHAAQAERLEPRAYADAAQAERLEPRAYAHAAQAAWRLGCISSLTS